MSIEDTRRLGIEFERRVQTMIPDTEFLDKLDTDTIYSFLNQYQDKYVHEIYRNLDQIPSGSHLSAHVEAVLQSMLKREKIPVPASDNADMVNYDIQAGYTVVGTGRSVTYPLDPAFYMYVRSVSQVSSTYSFKGGSSDEDKDRRVIPNELVSQSDVWKLIETPNDSLRILRYPAALLNQHTTTGKPTLTVIYDRYTTPEGIEITYYKQPQRFSLFTGTACELPLDAFDDLVSGAVDLYVQYVAGAEARKKQLEQARQEQAKEAERNAARRGRNSE